MKIHLLELRPEPLARALVRSLRFAREPLGAGVTTLGHALAAHLSLPYFDSDDYFWHPTDPPFTSPRPVAQRNALIREALTPNKNWILGGSIYRWGADTFPPFDLIVFLWLPPELRLARLRAREQARYGDKLQTDPIYKKHHAEFLAWAADYDHDTGIASRTLNAHEAWLKQHTGPILQLRGDLTVEQRIDRILAYIGNEK